MSNNQNSPLPPVRRMQDQFEEFNRMPHLFQIFAAQQTTTVLLPNRATTNRVIASGPDHSYSNNQVMMPPKMSMKDTLRRRLHLYEARFPFIADSFWLAKEVSLYWCKTSKPENVHASVINFFKYRISYWGKGKRFHQDVSVSDTRAARSRMMLSMYELLKIELNTNTEKTFYVLRMLIDWFPLHAEYLETTTMDMIFGLEDAFLPGTEFSNHHFLTQYLRRQTEQRYTKSAVISANRQWTMMESRTFILNCRNLTNNRTKTDRHLCSRLTYIASIPSPVLSEDFWTLKTAMDLRPDLCHKLLSDLVWTMFNRGNKRS